MISVKDRSPFLSLDISLDPKPYLKMYQPSPTGKNLLDVTPFTTGVTITSSVLCYRTKMYKQVKGTTGISERVITYVSLQKGKFF